METKITIPQEINNVNKIENRIRFEIKRKHYLEFLTPETIKIFGSIEKKIDTNKNSENVSHLKTTEVLLVALT